MTIPSTKPTKQCPYCFKEVRQLANHIINSHPTIIDKLEENNTSIDNLPQNVPYANPTQRENSSPVQTPRVAGDISSMIREKLETMLNIKIIQMLEKGASIEEVQRLTTPIVPQQSNGFEQLKELIKMQQLISPQSPSMVAEEPATDWAKLISESIPMIIELIKNKQYKNVESVNNGFNTGEFETTSPAILEPISAEVAGNTTKPGSIGKESRDYGSTIESINVGDERISKWIK